MTTTAGLRREKPHGPSGDKARQAIDERIGEITVTIAPPHNHTVHDLAGVLIFEVSVDKVLDGIAKVEIYIVVIPEFLHELAFVELKNFGKVVARSCNR